jgi:hypothetical protein
MGLIGLVGLACFGCSKKESEAQAAQQTAPPVAASAKAVAAGKKRFVVKESGSVGVMIDAPLEKFKGETKKLSGVFDVDVQDLANSTGEVVADLDGFVTSTFTDPDKNESQTEHAKNWFQIGEKVEKAERDDFRMARFTIEKIEKSSVKALADAKEEGSARTIHFTAKGTLRVHGRPSPKTVEVDVTFHGPADAPTNVSFKTTAPLVASLSEHDVTPRDVAGQFLAGALEKVGKKMDDKAQISIEGAASPRN